MAWNNVQYENGKYRTSSGGGGGASEFADLDDVNFSNLQNGQIPKYNSTTQKWENANESGGGGSVTDVEVNGTSVVNQGVAQITVPDKLSDLSDIAFSSLQDHQPLRYNATSQKWVNGADNYPPLIYSDEEREVGVWRDGKPLYQKTVQINGTGSQGRLYVDLGSTARLVSAYGITENQGYKRLVPMAYRGEDVYNISESIAVYQNLTTHLINFVYNGVDFGTAYVTFQYTKTTDTAGSGTWTTQGAYAHHYSTTEQVVGTWIDGKPLYEKTISLSAGDLPNANDSVQINHNISNLKYVVDCKGYVTNGQAYRSISSARLSSANVVGTAVFSTYVYIESGMDLRSYTGHITIQYTKTTDA